MSTLSCQESLETPSISLISAFILFRPFPPQSSPVSQLPLHAATSKKLLNLKSGHSLLTTASHFKSLKGSVSLIKYSLR